ncbi:hypothetical protein VTJ49DRAFT_6884 [Mycothermus thermophilus]|uniref:Uncharacterized protein n=1 Tax=Humicola insolens TaxID=85995 RepID=A0ABR3VQY1_HUMIN
MFLAALILASKYLQDRNYSARAWSKISGLDTLEINQNEMTFLLAVNWKLHVTEEVYKRWADCVSKFTPSQPPSPGAPGQQLYERQCYDFRRIILNLTPDLDNLDDLVPWTPVREQSPRSLYTPPGERSVPTTPDSKLPPATKPCSIPAVMEPAPSLSYGPGRLAPAFGFLPTPRLTPQLSGFSTPAASSASSLLGRSSSMGFAMAQVSASLAAHSMDRFWLASETSSPMSYVTRRSSLANSVSAASSPESMISDSSRVSRSSSLSSASSLPAPSSKSEVQARYRYAKLGGERLSVLPTIASVPEDHAEDYFTTSPESYVGPVGKELPLPLPACDVDDAARVLQDMHRSDDDRSVMSARAGSKRSRTNSVHDDVRDLLAGRFEDGPWPATLVRDRTQAQQVPVLRSSRKRVCCSAEAAIAPRIPSLQRAMGASSGQGMWSGLLN